MKITVIHGQNHKGSTYNAAKMLYDRLGGEVTEFFLPRDFNNFCTGCNNCFLKSETLCPHYEKLKPITEAMDNADIIILSSPVYVFHATGAMKAFLDHYGYRWMVHRPEKSMFKKQAVCICTAAGGGMKSTNKDMADSTFFWGIAKTYKLGFAVKEINWNNVKDDIKSYITKQIDLAAEKIKREYGKVKPSMKTKAFFKIAKSLHKKKNFTENDFNYWNERGWLKNILPWKD
ncbi:NAD(P)H-dependent oxidoreductase [uncultured Brachyspira sp.]|uniref:flavodoxin family protein n=1 Tax=uncultured Brachyspira sp. TaxID=221953 RepID=UPI00261F58CC|nr:NAD(P)H-dependent oxidoreductase [uncultured Brachyspira sp.]